MTSNLLFDSLLLQTIEVAREVGAFIRNERKNFDPNRIEQKSFNDLVSYVDKEAEKQIVDRLSQMLPEAGFITEEGTNTTRQDEFNWVIDPLDGTTNFIHGLPIFSVSIALMRFDAVVLGVVYEVNLDECFYAVKGGGAFCNGVLIHVSQAGSLASSLIATGFPYYEFAQLEKYFEVLKFLIRSTHGLRRLGSAAVDLCYVAAGRIDGYFEYNLNSYDVAAGALIVQEAGGIVTDFEGGGDYIFGRQIISTNGLIHPEFLAELKRIWG
jgi:myo-inositol-1(or 4)-monophosphatase